MTLVIVIFEDNLRDKFMSFKLSSKGNYNKTRSFLGRLRPGGGNFSELDKYGQMGVEALSQATPVKTGKTAASWGYRIEKKGVWIGIVWFNTNVTESFGSPSVAILLQYGHATRGGTFVMGQDYINPAMDRVFDLIVNEVWKKVTA